MADLNNNGDKALFIRGHSSGLRVLVLVLLSLMLMSLDRRSDQLDNLRDVLNVALHPLRLMVDMPTTLGEDMHSKLASRRELATENQRLRDRQMVLEAQMQKLAAIEKENERMRQLLQSSRKLHDDVLIAELLGVELDPYRHQLTLNKGASSGTYDGQPLIDAHGVMGQIVDSSAFSSTAVLITDASHSLPVEINRNGIRTIVRGTGEIDRLELPFLPKNTDVQVGDLIVTSGLGGRFPAGYPVAKVTEVRRDPAQVFAQVSAKPTAHLDRSRRVLLVWSEQQPADSTLPAAQLATGEDSPPSVIPRHQPRPPAPPASSFDQPLTAEGL